VPGAGADFLDLPARSGKPRSAGLTHVLDKGLPVLDLKSLVGAVAAHVDLWKLGWGTAYLDPSVEDKIALLREQGISACPGGTLLELAWLQGKQEAFLEWAAGCGFGCVEVSNGTVEMDRADKSALISAAAGRFTVLGEVGSKDPAVPVSPDDWIEQAGADLAAGARWVVTEGREGGSVGLYRPDGSVREQLVEQLVAAIDPDRLIFEAPRREQQAWLIRRLGPDVNLGNIATTEILGLETLRLGLRSDTLIMAGSARTFSGELRPAEGLRR
jgi:phosphosulfolactate synthase